MERAQRVDVLAEIGMGWCQVPEQLVAPHLADGLLVRLAIEDDPVDSRGSLTIYAAHLRDRPLGRARSWLLGELQRRLS